jgi:integrase/recombinase XerD
MKAYLEPEEVGLIAKAAKCIRDVLLILLLFYLGCRISELLALEVKDIDFTNATVTIQHLKQRLKLVCPNCQSRLGKSHTYCPKCGGKIERTHTEELQHRRQRVLPVDRDTLKMLEDYVRHGGPVVKEGKLLIFGINRHRAWQIIKECAERAGLPKLINPETGKVHNISPHRLRDAFATHAVKTNDSGDGLRMLQEHLGHQGITTTMKYRKISGREQKAWYKQLWKGDKP